MRSGFNCDASYRLKSRGLLAQPQMLADVVSRRDFVVLMVLLPQRPRDGSVG
jgi:hypothetical protein